jgi:phosphonate transport system permease protein
MSGAPKPRTDDPKPETTDFRKIDTGLRLSPFSLFWILVAIAAYWYGSIVTEVDLGKLANGVREGYFTRILNGLVSPDLLSREVQSVALEAPLVVGQPAGGATVIEQGGVRIELAPVPVPLDGTLTISGSGLPPGSEGRLRLLEPNRARTITTVTADRAGQFREVLGPEIVERIGAGAYTFRAEVTAATGAWRVSDTLALCFAKMIETIFLALIGTAWGVLLSVPLSFLGARNIMSGSALSRAVYYLTRTFFNLTRSIEVMIVAIIMAVIVGIGPFAGVLALVVHSIGAMGKLYSEAIESIDPGPIEAITATGASRFQVVLYAVVPQVIPAFISFTMYRWDINVRMSTVIGLVGGGGIGFILKQYIDLLQWNQAATALWLIALVVMAMDYASTAIRSRVI